MKEILIAPFLLLLFGLCYADESSTTTTTSTVPPTTTLAPSSKNYHVYGNGTRVPFPLRAALKKPLVEGTTVHVKGRITDNPQKVVVNFQKGAKGEEEIPFHFSNRFTEGLLRYKMVFNNLVNGVWNTDEVRKETPFVPGGEFDFRVHFHSDTHFTVYGNREKIGVFEARKGLEDFNVIMVDGDLAELEAFHFGGMIYQTPYKFNVNFGPGKTLAISGMPTGDTFRLRVHQNSNVSEIPLEIKFDYYQQFIGINAYTNGTWGQEDRSAPFALKRNELVDIALVHEQDASLFHIYNNGAKIGTFDHQLTGNKVIDSLEIMGDFDLHTGTIGKSAEK